MSFEAAVRLTEILMALCFLQQSAEHLTGDARERLIFAPRLVLSLLLFAGIAVPWILLGLLALGLAALVRFQGPYNGGSDRMSLLMLCCLTALSWVPTRHLSETIFAYFAFQLCMSYVISGWVKIRNPEWRRGDALADVFRFSAYPVSESLRGWAGRPGLLFVMGWGVMLFEVLFPLSLLHPATLPVALIIAAGFHLCNACLFGLNRFFWIWLAAYPSILWFQDRLIGV